MGHEAPSGAEWLPGELDALFDLEPPDEQELSEDDYLSMPDWDEPDLAAEFAFEDEVASVPDRFAAAVARLRSAADELAELAGDPGLVLSDRDSLIGWTQEIERSRNILQVPDQSLINLMESTGCRIEGPIGLYASPQAFVSALLGIPFGEAKARVRAAKLLAPTLGMTGEQVPPRYPVLAAAEATGEISADRIDLLTKAFVDWEKLVGVAGNNVTARSLSEAEELLAGQAKVFGVRQLVPVIDRVAGWLVPDGMVDDRPAQDAVRSLELHQIRRGANRGMYRLEGWLTAEVGAKASAVLDPLSKPQPVVDESGRLVEPDRRDRGQRMHDGLEAVMDRSLRAGELPAHGGTPATLILIAEEDDLVAGTGTGSTETGDILPMDRVVGLADEAEIVRTVFGKETREVLNLGRTRRLASYGQTLALTARDGGCTFPGCGKSPKWCQRHHIVDWVKGGSTDLANLTLICAFHHYRFARHGWSAEYRQGRVWWRPPKIIDPDRKPILNTRHRDYPLIT